MVEREPLLPARSALDHVPRAEQTIKGRPVAGHLPQVALLTVCSRRAATPP